LHPNLPGELTNSEAVGLYKAPYKLLESVQSFAGLFMAALFPFLAKYAQERDARLPAMCQKAFDGLAAIAVPMAVGTVLLAGPIIDLLTGGAGWNRSVPTLQILIVSVAFSFINNLSAYLVLAVRGQRRLIVPNLIYFAFNLIANFLLIPRLGHNGSAVATVFTELLILFVNFYVVHRVLAWLPTPGRLLRILPAAALMGLLIWMLDRSGVSFWLTAPLSAMTYLFILDAIGGLPDELRLRRLRDKLLKSA
jgi:O-antigen/teichoic acid export membrane protein